MLNLQSIYFGQRHANFDYKDFDIVKKVSRLARKHHRQCENDCNGEGWVKDMFYRCNSAEGYIFENGKPTDKTKFQAEIERIEKKILYTLESRKGYKNFKVDFQHDPRGCTIKLYYEGDFIEF